tara:strand:+ start:704 stop:856 length:153 start_codon:yes stop_codon:yes gene_type:complete
MKAIIWNDWMRLFSSLDAYIRCIACGYIDIPKKAKQIVLNQFIFFSKLGG